MIIRNPRRVLTALALLAAAGLTPASAAPSAPSAKPVSPVKVAAPAVLVSLGDAMQEEYHGGDPSRRTTVYPSGETAHGPKPAAGDKKHS